jgi:hypothetical protein
MPTLFYPFINSSRYKSIAMEDSAINNDINGYRKKTVELAFPKYKGENDDDEYISKGKGTDLLSYFSTGIDEVTDWFKQYQVDTIELWISGVVETGGITRLVVSAKGEGGLRVILKPKNQSV